MRRSRSLSARSLRRCRPTSFYFFTEFGPNSTIFVYPAELFPVMSRTTGHGIASAAGKLGRFFGVFLFPILMSWGGGRSDGCNRQRARRHRHADHAAGDQGKSLEELNQETAGAAQAA
jgi:hypothetical protein